jgi:hypothetical protein
MGGRGTFETMLPSRLTILAAVVVAFFIVLTVVRGPIDADFWWHLTTGRLILESGSVPSVDPFSFAYDGPWVAHEWLGEVIIAGLVDTVGFGVTAALFGLAAAGALLVPAYALHRNGVAVRALLPWIVIGTYTLAAFATVRPQVLSWLLLAVLIVLLLGITAEDRVRPWLVLPLMLVWANLHGLYVAGLGVIGLYAVFTIFGATALAKRWWIALGMLVGAVAVSALTPAGPEGLLYPLRYLRQDDWGTAFIAEWQSANFTDPRQWGVVLLFVAAVLLGRRTTPLWIVTLAVVGLLSAVVAVRNAPLAILMSMPMLALTLQDRLGPAPEAPPAQERPRRMLEMGLAAIVIVAFLVVLPRVASGSEESAFPSEALTRLQAMQPDARLLVDYDWAGYAIHRIHGSGGSVFIDGRSDMYPREVFEDYLSIRSAAPGWEELVAHYRVQGLLLPPSAPVVEAVDDTWCEAFRDERAVLLLVDCGRLGGG